MLPVSRIRRTALFAAIGAALLAGTPGFSLGETKAEREADFVREGLLVCEPIRLVVEGLDRDAKKIGLSEEDLESIAKSRGHARRKSECGKRGRVLSRPAAEILQELFPQRGYQYHIEVSIQETDNNFFVADRHLRC